MDIVKEAYVDHTQFDKKDPHYDPKSSKVINGNEFRILNSFCIGQSQMVHGGYEVCEKNQEIYSLGGAQAASP